MISVDQADGQSYTATIIKQKQTQSMHHLLFDIISVQPMPDALWSLFVKYLSCEEFIKEEEMKL